MTERNARLELVSLLFVYGSSKAPPTRADARAALLPLIKHVGDAEAKRRIDAALDACTAAGDLQELAPPGKQRSPRFGMSRSGEERLQAEFGKIGKASWTKLRDGYLIPRAAVGSSSAAPPAGLKSYPALRVYLALRSSGIEYRAAQTTNAALDRIVAKAIGAPRAEPSAIKTALIRLWLGADMAAARPSAQSATTHAEALSDDLSKFARDVNEAAQHSPTGRWGSEKVFVNHVWRRLQSLGLDAGLNEATFKNRLLEANQRGLVRLSRADLVISMPPNDVTESEIATLGDDVFHFVNVPTGKS